MQHVVHALSRNPTLKADPFPLSTESMIGFSYTESDRQSVQLQDPNICAIIETQESGMPSNMGKYLKIMSIR